MSNRFEVKNRIKPIDNVVLSVKDLKKSFGKKEVLKGINFDLYQFETLAIIGKNGAGKTLTMECILGIQEKTSGDIYLNLGHSKWVDNLGEVGMQFQASQLSGTKTVKKLISFYKKFYRDRINNETYSELEKIFNIESILKNKLNQLSGGQKQRLNLFLSVIHNPKLMILDEFITGLDISSVKEIINAIYELKINNEASMIVISHQPEEIQALADRVILFKDGVIAEDLLMKEIIDEYGSVSLYLESVI